MSKKEGLPARSPKRNKQEDTTTEPRFVNPSVTFYPGGVMFHRPVKGKGKGGAIGKRGTISGWSSASRKRMREWMLTYGPKDGWTTFGATFTVPGPVLEMATAKNLWKHFCREVERQGWSMVWRIEIQSRGAHHWHAMISQQVKHPSDIDLLWHSALRELPEVEHTTAKGYACTGKRTALPGADLYACKIEGGGDRGAWMRYMQDHCSKAKQEQIPEDIGRHWGIVGRKHFVERNSTKVELADKAYAKVMRWTRRLATPIRPNPKAPFGKSLSYSPRRGMYGKSVWYSSPITIARFTEWAMRLEAQKHEAWEEYRRDNA